LGQGPKSRLSKLIPRRTVKRAEAVARSRSGDPTGQDHSPAHGSATQRRTSFGVYGNLYGSSDHFVVIDDVEGLHADRTGVRLLKCLCQTEGEKSVAWHSDARTLERRGIPREFTTKSRAIIISNDWKTPDNSVAALQDCGHVIFFQPSAAEVHRKAGERFGDREIYECFGKNLHDVRELSLRYDVRVTELKAAGMDWTNCWRLGTATGAPTSQPGCWKATPTAPPPSASRHSSRRAGDVGRRSSTIEGGWERGGSGVGSLRGSGSR